jgi:hypothetical protein
MTTRERTFDPGVAQSVASLPGPPDYWSYSTLQEIESCARQYVLGRASYPDIWNGKGYPQQPRPAALFGDVVHESLERIIKALVRAGCTSSNSAEATAVLRELGGYSAVAAEALAGRLARLNENPRLDEVRRARLQQFLEDRIPEARAEIQGYLQRTALVPKPGGFPGVGGGVISDRPPLGVGSHPEVSLRSEELRVIGRVDLITVTAERADIVDHKTGAEDPSHLEQLRFYAMLWDQDDVANQDRTPVGTLTASYLTTEVTIFAPDAEDLVALAADTVERVAEADSEVLAEVPRATVGEQCAFCSVRSLCEEYWNEIAPDPADLISGTWFDYEGVVSAQNGARSWWLEDTRRRQKVLVRTPPLRSLSLGQRLRILGLRREDDPAVDAPVAILTTNSELFVLGDESVRAQN